jgi:hypothetical protein
MLFVFITLPFTVWHFHKLRRHPPNCGPICVDARVIQAGYGGKPVFSERKTWYGRDGTLLGRVVRMRLCPRPPAEFRVQPRLKNRRNPEDG